MEWVRGVLAETGILVPLSLAARAVVKRVETAVGEEDFHIAEAEVASQANYLRGFLITLI